MVASAISVHYLNYLCLIKIGTLKQIERRLYRNIQKYFSAIQIVKTIHLKRLALSRLAFFLNTK